MACPLSAQGAAFLQPSLGVFLLKRVSALWWVRLTCICMCYVSPTPSSHMHRTCTPVSPPCLDDGGSWQFRVASAVRLCCCHPFSQLSSAILEPTGSCSFCRCCHTALDLPQHGLRQVAMSKRAVHALGPLPAGTRPHTGDGWGDERALFV